MCFYFFFSIYIVIVMLCMTWCVFSCCQVAVKHVAKDRVSEWGELVSHRFIRLLSAISNIGICSGR